jgi:hypothetical protein
LIRGIYKEYIRHKKISMAKKQNNPISKWAINLNKHFSRDKI